MPSAVILPNLATCTCLGRTTGTQRFVHFGPLVLKAVLSNINPVADRDELSRDVLNPAHVPL